MVTILAVKIKEKENLSMIRIITPRGEMWEVKRAVAVCEMRQKFNGRLNRKIEIAKDLSCNPTGLCLQLDVNGTGFATFGQELFIGNLKSEEVQEILRKLLKEGYFDFSELEYQKENMVEKTTFDAGKSKPYASDYVIGICSSLLCGGAIGVFDTMCPSVCGGDAGTGEETRFEYDEEGLDYEE